MEKALEESVKDSFSLTRYLSRFSQFTQFYPEITPGSQDINVTDTDVSAIGEFRVVVRVGSYAGVNSSEIITSSVPTDLFKRVKAAKEFVSTGGLDNVLSTIDICTSKDFGDPAIESYVQNFKNGLDSADIDVYDHWAEVEGSGDLSGSTRCIEFNTLHHLDPGDFRFRTEIFKCQNC